MGTLRCWCYKLAASLPLTQIAEVFQVEWTSRLNYLVLKGASLDRVLHQRAPRSQQVYLFEFGCVTLVDFEESDAWAFLSYLSSIVGKLDMQAAFRFNEHHNLEVVENTCYLWEGQEEPTTFGEWVIGVVALVLAKSAALTAVESDAGRLLDEAEDLIARLQRGHLHLRTRKFAATIARMLRFQYDSVGSIGIFDVPRGLVHTLQAKAVYDDFAEHYELHQRFEHLQNKMQELQRITELYSKLSYKYQENRLCLFEILLLMLFPLSHLLHAFLER